VLQVTGASKQFAGAVALDDVAFDVLAGEIHALLGQNGSGKSTLIKCLSGFHAPDPGWRLRVNDTELDRPLHPGEFRQLGMSFVHQDLGLIPSLEVAENLRMGWLISEGSWRVRWRVQRRLAADLLEEFGIGVDPSSTVDRLRPVDRAIVAIIRAVHELRRWKHNNPGAEGVLFLDEATALLDRHGKSRIADLLRRIAAEGSGIVVVSHDLREVVEVASRFTILRDGRAVATTSSTAFAGGSGVEQLIEHITGARREVGRIAQARRAVPLTGDHGFEIRAMSGDVISNFSTTLRRGEVLGVTGVVGSGWDEVPLLLAGASRARSGTLRMDDVEYPLPRMSPKRAVAAGIALVPANRQEEGLVGELSIESNLTLPRISEFMRRGFLNGAAERRFAAATMDTYDVTPRLTQLPIESLSGGNQQKAVMARWLSVQPKLLLLQDPTQGVDVAARERIHDIVWRAARNGMAVIYASADYEELAAVADRVLVLGDGLVTDEFVDDQVEEEELAASALRGQPRFTTRTEQDS
jgi:ribose transport system ATP-binding protein